MQLILFVLNGNPQASKFGLVLWFYMHLVEKPVNPVFHLIRYWLFSFEKKSKLRKSQFCPILIMNFEELFIISLSLIDNRIAGKD